MMDPNSQEDINEIMTLQEISKPIDRQAVGLPPRSKAGGHTSGGLPPRNGHQNGSHNLAKGSGSINKGSGSVGKFNDSINDRVADSQRDFRASGSGTQVKMENSFESDDGWEEERD